MKRLTTEEFLAKAKEVHGVKYDYSKVMYINNCTKVTIGCSTHGDFEQEPNKHLKGHGCPKCSHYKSSIDQRYTTSEFVKRASEKHNNFYSYLKTVYLGKNSKIIITCPIHGDFEQKAKIHLRGSGCQKCSINNIKNKQTDSIEFFITKANLKHKNFYDYSKTVYVNSYNKVIITCPIHGDFLQAPVNHLQGHGCPICARIKTIESNTSNTEEFIAKAKAIHGDKYDYSKTVYVNVITKVIITCPFHGDFEQNPSSHLNGQGCPKCGLKRSGDKQRKSLEEFVTKAKEVHGDRYDYSEFIYESAKIKGKIRCVKCGNIFSQPPFNHLSGTGCPSCSSSKGELTIRHVLFKNKIDQTPEYKIPQLSNRYEYDFYLSEYNLLIEFHGIQHYKYIPYFHRNGEDDFLKQKNRDDLVRHFAKEFKYNYLEFNYKQLKELGTEKFQELVLKSIYKFKKKT